METAPDSDSDSDGMDEEVEDSDSERMDAEGSEAIPTKSEAKTESDAGSDFDDGGGF